MKSKVALKRQTALNSRTKKIKRNRLSPTNRHRDSLQQRSDTTAPSPHSKKPTLPHHILISRKKPLPKKPTPSPIPNLFESQSLHQFYHTMSILVQKTQVNSMTVNQTLKLCQKFFSLIHDPTRFNADLVVLSGFLVVTKFYERWGKVRVRDLVVFAGGMFSGEEIVEMEEEMLRVVGWEIVEE